jgi:hypothetical protein
MAFADNAFDAELSSPEQIYNLVIPPGKAESTFGGKRYGETGQLPAILNALLKGYRYLMLSHSITTSTGTDFETLVENAA